MDDFTKMRADTHKEFLESMVNYYDGGSSLPFGSEIRIVTNANWRIYNSFLDSFEKTFNNLTPKILTDYMKSLRSNIYNNNGSSLPFDSEERFEANAYLSAYSGIHKNIQELFPEIIVHNFE